ncbi:hypothetical protein KP509_11G066600 [Ceratopteris richardii]|nr:hypothetical protein KP509_11G066600 [Ceratopteris richardii]
MTFRQGSLRKWQRTVCSPWSRKCLCTIATEQLQPLNSSSSANACKTVKKKVALWVGYVGTNYKGLQIQRTTADGQTIEQELETAIFRAGGILESNFGALEKIGWMRSSRTDKGVHSLSTVITMKLEINPETWRSGDGGIELADRINQYLPRTIKIFSIVPVGKSFDPRRGCRSRLYRYLLPAASVGIIESMSSEEVQQRIFQLRAILSSYVGRYPYHNYTVRSQYRAQYRKKDSTSKKDSLSNENSHQNGKLFIFGADDSHDEDESADDFPLDDSGSSSCDTSASSSMVQAANSIHSAPKIRWLDEIDMKDRISSCHFRSIYSFACGDLQECQGLHYLELNVHGESFMLHQIRKMVGTAVAIMREILPSDIVPISLSCSSRVVLPLAPSEGLFLAGNEFHPFRTSPRPSGSEKPDNLPKLHMSPEVLQRKEQFWHDVLLPHMVTLLRENKTQWEEWLELLERARMNEAEMHETRKAWNDWRTQLEKRKAMENDAVDEISEMRTISLGTERDS